MEVFVAVMPGQPISPAFIPAHMTYRIGGNCCLMGLPSRSPASGGLMLVDNGDYDGDGDPYLCAQQIIAEYRTQQYRGVVCDFEGIPLPSLFQLINILEEEIADLHIPEAYASVSDTAKVLISTAITAGTLEKRLLSARSKYGNRLTLAAEWLREDIPLPCSGRGTPVSQKELEDQIHRLEPAIFFDRGLCAHYYTYMRGTQAHIVLFDTQRSVREKLIVAERLGITTALLPPEAASQAS